MKKLVAFILYGCVLFFRGCGVVFLCFVLL